MLLGIQNNEEGYAPASTEYENASPGVGAVLRSVLEYNLLAQLIN